LLTLINSTVKQLLLDEVEPKITVCQWQAGQLIICQGQRQRQILICKTLTSHITLQ